MQCTIVLYSGTVVCNPLAIETSGFCWWTDCVWNRGISPQVSNSSNWWCDEENENEMRIFYDDSVEAITAAHPKTAVSKHLHIPSSISSVRDLFSISRLWRFAIAARWALSPPTSLDAICPTPLATAAAEIHCCCLLNHHHHYSQSQHGGRHSIFSLFLFFKNLTVSKHIHECFWSVQWVDGLGLFSLSGLCFACWVECASA